jgi:hypothetical protein
MVQVTNQPFDPPQRADLVKAKLSYDKCEVSFQGIELIGRLRNSFQINIKCIRLLTNTSFEVERAIGGNSS